MYVKTFLKASYFNSAQPKQIGFSQMYFIYNNSVFHDSYNGI